MRSVRTNSIAEMILQLVGEDGVIADDLRSSAEVNRRSLANRLSELKYEGLIVTKYELTEAGKRLLRKLNSQN